MPKKLRLTEWCFPPPPFFATYHAPSLFLSLPFPYRQHHRPQQAPLYLPPPQPSLPLLSASTNQPWLTANTAQRTTKYYIRYDVDATDMIFYFRLNTKLTQKERK